MKEYAADFETTSYEGQDKTEVWAASICEIGSEDVIIYNNIDAFMNYVFSLGDEVIIYFHNLKFDGSFILNWLLKHGFKNGLYKEGKEYDYKSYKKLNNKEIIPIISDKGQWYKITIKFNNNKIEFRDSFKKISMSIGAMPGTFNLKYRKTEIEYVGERHAGGEMTEKEKEYIKNDTLILSEALDYINKDKFSNKLTTGSMSLADFKDIEFNSDEEEFVSDFPNLCYITREKPGYTNFDMVNKYKDCDEYFRPAYRGGWCYVNKYKEKKVLTDGCVCDVNSLYPSMMHSSSGNHFPVGYPKFFKGRPPKKVLGTNRYYYFIRIRCNFVLKDGFLPFMQIKDDIRYNATEMLETSYKKDKEGNDIKYRYNEMTGKYEKQCVELTLTQTDWTLFKEHYNIYDLEFVDGCYFNTIYGIFDNYINKWAEIKKNNKGGMRYLAKLHLNSLYGKFGTRPDASFKIPYMKDDKLTFYTVSKPSKKTAIYIPMACAITAYARSFTITAAQANYHKGERGFIYADTDSIHCDCDVSDIKGVKFDDVEFNCWKIERTWDKAYFVRGKTYIEVEGNDMNLKTAGMPQNCKDMFKNSFLGTIPEYDDCNEDEKRFYYDENKNPIKRGYKDFDIGLSVPGKLIPKQIPGGCKLVETDFTMKPNTWR